MRLFGLSIMIVWQLVAVKVCCSQAQDTFSIQPLVVPHSQSSWLNMGRGEIKIIVPSEHTRGKWALLERKETPGFQTDLHKHSHMDEAFYVLAGQLSVWLRDTIYTLNSGSYVLIPKGTPHAQGNLTKDTTRILSFFLPGGFEKFALERVEITKKYNNNSDAYSKAVYESLQRHDMQILGPPPFKK